MEKSNKETENKRLLVCIYQIYLSVAFVNRMSDGLYEVVPHAALWVSVNQLLVPLITSLAAAGSLNEAQ